ncbi:glycoside hydrolase family 57 protein [Candidatus Bathyarchaeota archaeon]|nr:glycoside hydrolase family 57 protein [Candidatus Bathyarchaeota archaeon]
MPSVCFYFQVHQPIRLNKFTIFSENIPYFDDYTNKKIFERVAKKCYLPTNQSLLDLIDDIGKKFRIAFSLTGVFLEQCLKYSPEVLGSFKQLSNTGNVEFLSETYYHSLAALFSTEEFKEQIALHNSLITKLFNRRATIFRNSEAMYSNDIAKIIENLGYAGIITEGHEKILSWHSPNYLYRPKGCEKTVALLRNYKLSDDIGFRFSDKGWKEHPLTSDKYANWLSACEGDCINIFMDYETFGEHQWKETGIFDFLKTLPYEILKHENLDFKTPSEIIASNKPIGVIDVPEIISWADVQRDASAWLENDMQKYAFREMVKLEKLIQKNRNLLHVWRLLQTSDHFYYMCTKWFADGDVHKYFNPYDSPYDAFINYMNILQDIKRRVSRKK